MKMGYTKREVKQIIKIQSLYQMSCVNWIGKTVKDKEDDGGEYYSEIIAECVLNNEKLLNLPQGRVRDNFAFLDHDGNTEKEDSPRKEERFCLDWYKNRNNKISPFGKIINYQVNVFKGTKINVDLVAYDDKNDTLWLIEVKGHDGKSKETLLRCVLEIETYYRCLQPNMQVLRTTLCSKDEEVKPFENTEIKKGIWVPAGSRAALEFADLNNRPHLFKLIEKWGIRVETY